MKPVATKKILSLLVLAFFLSAGTATAQPDDLPPRSFQRFGTPKMRHGSRILSLAYSPNGQILAAGGGNDPVRLWNPKTGEMIRAINEPWVHAMTYTVSGETLIFGGFQKHIRLWNFKLKKESGRLDGHKATVKALAVSADTTTIASGSQDGAIYLWDMNNKRKIGELVGHADEVTALVFAPDKEISLLISAGSDRAIFIWDTERNQSKQKLDGGCGVYALALSADGKTLYSAGDDYLIRRWNLATGKQTGIFKGHEGIIVSLFVQGDTIISGALDKTIRFWDAKTTEQRRSLSRAQGDCDALAVTRTGDFLATAGLNNTIRLFEAGNGKELIHAPGIQSGLVGLVLSPDNQRLAAASADGQIHVWDRQAGKLLRKWHAKQTGDILLAFSADSKLLATASNIAQVWNVETGDPVTQAPTRESDPVMSLAFAPDGKTLALGLHSGAIELYDVKNEKSAGSFKYPGALQAIAWSRDGKKLAAAGGAKILVWDAQSKSLGKSFDVKEGPSPFPVLIASLAFAPDGKSLAAGGWDAVIRIFNLNSKNPGGAKEHRLCEGHVSAVYSVAFSPDSRSLVSGSFDKTIRLWETFSGKSIAVFKGHVGEVRGVAFVNDGRSVYSAGSDSLVYQWDVPGLLNNGKLPELTLAFQELDAAWNTLTTEETARGHEMMWRCIASSRQAVPHLTKNLYYLDPDRVKKLFRELDSSHYPTRTAAMSELTRYGRWMEGRYDSAMANAPSLEYKRRVEILKEKLNASNSPSLVQERLRVRRIMLMCEQVGSPEAVEALRKLADKGPEEELREEAQGSLQRLKK